MYNPMVWKYNFIEDAGIIVHSKDITETGRCVFGHKNTAVLERVRRGDD